MFHGPLYRASILSILEECVVNDLHEREKLEKKDIRAADGIIRSIWISGMPEFPDRSD